MGRTPRTRALVELGDLARGAEGDGLVHYLYARNLEAIGAYDRAIHHTRTALRAGLPGPSFVREAEQMLGRQLLRGGSFEAAKDHFQTMAGAAKRPVDALRASDWAQRAEIAGKRRPSKKE